MAEYIEREVVDKVIDTARKMYLNDFGAVEVVHQIKSKLCNMPNADVQPVDRWINAQTNPPIATDGKTSDYVLVLRKSGYQCVCYYVYDNDGNYWMTEDEKSMYEVDEVTHWQPLPESPKQ